MVRLVGIALALAVVEGLASLALRQVLLWFGWERLPNSLLWSTIKLGIALGVLALLVLIASL